MDAKDLIGNHWTVEEYLALEASSPERYEYHDGYIIAMSGGTVTHNDICVNLVQALSQTARAKGCRVATADVRFQFSSHRYYYPDVLITCEPVSPTQQSILQPCFIAEVLSPSTERYDLGKKLVAYTHHPSIQTILYIVQTERLVYVYQRTPEGWEIEDLTSGDIQIPCIGAMLTLDQIYAHVDFPTL